MPMSFVPYPPMATPQYTRANVTMIGSTNVTPATIASLSGNTMRLFRAVISATAPTQVTVLDQGPTTQDTTLMTMNVPAGSIVLALDGEPWATSTLGKTLVFRSVGAQANAVIYYLAGAAS